MLALSANRASLSATDKKQNDDYYLTKSFRVASAAIHNKTASF
jgi:hypothetical protein